MKIELRSLSSIKPYAKNPRKNEAAIGPVAESIRQFGFRVPIVVDKDGTIVCGHTRYKAAQKLGLTEVPVHVAAELTLEQCKAYRLADNKTGSLAEFDFDLLPAEILDLSTGEIDLADFGFGDDEGKKYGISALQDIAIRPAPRMVWTLIGVPLLDWPGIAEQVQQLALSPGAIVETVGSDAAG